MLGSVLTEIPDRHRWSRARPAIDGQHRAARLANADALGRDREDLGTPAHRPTTHLAGFKGVLQVDGYEAYGVLARRSEVPLAFFWSHVRRQFYELASGGAAPIAAEALARMAALYRIEGEIRGRSAEERRAVRQQRSRPLVAALEPWLREKLALVSQKSRLAAAIRYTLSRWAGLVPVPGGWPG